MQANESLIILNKGLNSILLDKPLLSSEFTADLFKQFSDTVHAICQSQIENEFFGLRLKFLDKIDAYKLKMLNYVSKVKELVLTNSEGQQRIDTQIKEMHSETLSSFQNMLYCLTMASVLNLDVLISSENYHQNYSKLIALIYLQLIDFVTFTMKMMITRENYFSIA